MGAGAILAKGPRNLRRLEDQEEEEKRIVTLSLSSCACVALEGLKLGWKSGVQANAASLLASSAWSSPAMPLLHSGCDRSKEPSFMFGGWFGVIWAGPELSPPTAHIIQTEPFG